MLDDAVAASAPGKVLLAGGYLVLDRAYTGLVFGLDARIHVVAKGVPTGNGVTLQEITVTSPQFEGAVWQYGYRMAERDSGVDVTPLRADADLRLDRNVFLETALTYTLSYVTSIAKVHIKPAHVFILADNDYYSSPKDIDRGAGAGSQFYNFALPLSRASKTGLGSSAALVTAFTAALLKYYLPTSIFDLATETGKRRLHNLAQAAHCAAQGKVGSGFDVASAVFGSCLYRRFSPSLLMDRPEAGAKGFATQLCALINESGSGASWDMEIVKEAVKVPKGLRLVMCDVRCGSQTPGMVKKVLAWRKEKPEEAKIIWDELQEANKALAKEMKSVAEQGSDGYERLTQCFTRIRHGMRLMSRESDVPIEPPAQTELLDACTRVDGVIGGVVPGAGGFDAISLLIQDTESTYLELEQLLSEWTFAQDGGSVGKASSVSILRVREEMSGVKSEDASFYKTWLP
ncbi:ERG8, Phosphomevalonate kinase [Polychaeton citri CBS 116435]|uniref:Phosphomevalonate kinase n=1 Tax=Polychaeton citri CBS 116435 TaxID=1314669 RepID=A0A9P4Q4V0_9PEZI|nr:ERG8, Phosphomevalonate kinase [Polychaeton citri CBS 116435]